jgi:hypothetical protein
MDAVGGLSDDELIARFARAVGRDNRNTEELLRLIDEIDRRRLWAERAYSSMFAFCVERFRMSESVAYKRIGVARLARRFPVIFAMVGRGEVHLAGVLRLRAVLTEENHVVVLGRAKHRTLKEIDALVAELAPRPDIPSRVRALPLRKGEAALPASGRLASPQRLLIEDSAPPGGGQVAVASGADKSVHVRSHARSRPLRRAPDPKPLSPRRYKLEVTIDEVTRATLERLQDLLAHQLPNGDPAVIVSRALELLLEKTLKTKAALTDRPRGDASPPAQRDTSTPNPRNAPTPEQRDASTPARRKRYIPAAIRRAVWERDGGRCGYVGPDGRRCNETRGLEFAHTKPWAKGCEHSVETIGLRCRGHNDFEAIRDFGEEFMAEKKGSKVGESIAAYARCVVRPSVARAPPHDGLQPGGRPPAQTHSHRGASVPSSVAVRP